MAKQELVQKGTFSAVLWP